MVFEPHVSIVQFCHVDKALKLTCISYRILYMTSSCEKSPKIWTLDNLTYDIQQTFALSSSMGGLRSRFCGQKVTLKSRLLSIFQTDDALVVVG